MVGVLPVCARRLACTGIMEASCQWSEPVKTWLEFKHIAPCRPGAHPRDCDEPDTVVDTDKCHHLFVGSPWKAGESLCCFLGKCCCWLLSVPIAFDVTQIRSWHLPRSDEKVRGMIAGFGALEGQVVLTLFRLCSSTAGGDGLGECDAAIMEHSPPVAPLPFLVRRLFRGMGNRCPCGNSRP